VICNAFYWNNYNFSLYKLFSWQKMFIFCQKNVGSSEWTVLFSISSTYIFCCLGIVVVLVIMLKLLSRIKGLN